jgi:hypothetical protein
MKRVVGSSILAGLLLCSATAFASNVGVDVNIRVGDPPRPVVVHEPAHPPRAVVVHEPVYPAHHEVDVSGEIQFILPGALGFYVAVGHPHDLFYVQNRYYLVRDGRWYRSHYSRGPWVVVARHDLPEKLRRHKLHKIRHYRDQEYVVYRRDRDGYRGRHFRAGHEVVKEHRRDDKEHRKYEKRMEKEERKYEKRLEKEERRDRKRGDRDD